MSNNVGKVVQVIGTVVDVEFPQENLPEIYNALELEVEGEKLVLEVEQHVGNNWARCLALGATEGVSRGLEVSDTGAPVSLTSNPLDTPSVAPRAKHLAQLLPTCCSTSKTSFSPSTFNSNAL